MKEEALRRNAAQKSENVAAIPAQSTATKHREVGKCPACGGKMKENGKGGFVCPYCDTRTAPEGAAASAADGDAAVTGAGQTADPAAERAAKRAGFRKKYFSASTIAKLAMFAALAFGVSYLEFPIFPAASFLQLDFSCVFVLLGGFMFGPVAAIIISGVKECLRLFTTSTAGIGELANFIVTVSFVLIPTLVYRFKKGLPTVIVTLVVGCLIQVGVGLLTNRYINFPLFMQEVAAAMFAQLWWYVLLFNLIKSVAVSLITVLLYKRISWLLNKF